MKHTEEFIYKYESGRLKFDKNFTYSISIKKLAVKSKRYGFKTNGGKKILATQLDKLDTKHFTFYSRCPELESEVGLRITLFLAAEDYGISLEEYESLSVESQLDYLERFETAMVKTAANISSYTTTTEEINTLNKLFWCELNRERLEAERKAREEEERARKAEAERILKEQEKIRQERRKAIEKEEAERRKKEQELEKKFGSLQIPQWTTGDSNYMLGAVKDEHSVVNANIGPYNFKVLKGNLYINGLRMCTLRAPAFGGERILYLSHNNVYLGHERLFSAYEYAAAVREAQDILSR